MNLIDTLTDLKYERGLVCFRLRMEGSSASPLEVAAPFAAYAVIMKTFGVRDADLRKSHAAWLEDEEAKIARPTETTDEASNAAPEPRLGKRLASI